MMEIPSHVRAFWGEFLGSLSDPADAELRYYNTCRIGSTEADADEGAQLILRGEKIATSSLLWEYEATGKPLPKVGFAIPGVVGDAQTVIRTAIQSNGQLVN